MVAAAQPSEGGGDVADASVKPFSISTPNLMQSNSSFDSNGNKKPQQ
jgi:hypothetical protein